MFQLAKRLSFLADWATFGVFDVVPGSKAAAILLCGILLEEKQPERPPMTDGILLTSAQMGS